MNHTRRIAQIDAAVERLRNSPYGSLTYEQKLCLECLNGERDLLHSLQTTEGTWKLLDSCSHYLPKQKELLKSHPKESTFHLNVAYMESVLGTWNKVKKYA